LPSVLADPLASADPLAGLPVDPARLALLVLADPLAPLRPRRRQPGSW